MSEPRKSFFSNVKMRALLALVAIGLVLSAWQPIELQTVLDWGERVETSWWFLPAAMLVMALLFTFGLPGSLGLWLIAPFNHPVLATILLVIASTVGACGAYRFSRRLGSDWRPSGASARVVDVLEQRGGLLTLLALRMLPGFPHSVINFASGVIILPMKTFLPATILGLAIKWAVYASAIYGVTDAAREGEDIITMGTVLPLIVLVVMTLAAAWFRRRMG